MHHKKNAYQAVNVALVYRNWLIGYRIAEESLNDDNRAEYGAEIIKKLSKELPNCSNNLKRFFPGHIIAY